MLLDLEAAQREADPEAAWTLSNPVLINLKVRLCPVFWRRIDVYLKMARRRPRRSGLLVVLRSKAGPP